MKTFLIGLLSLFAIASNAFALSFGTMGTISTFPCSNVSGAVSGATCYEATISHTNLDDITAYWAYHAGSNGRLIIYQGGDPDTSFWGGPGSIAPFAADDQTNNNATLQIAWSVNPFVYSTSGGTPIASASREATLLEYIDDTYGSTYSEIDVRAHSEGTSLMLFSFMDYGLNFVTKMMMSAPTPLGDFKKGCTNSNPTNVSMADLNVATQSTPNPCNASGPITSNAYIPYLGGNNVGNTWTGTTTCSSGSATQADKNIWAATSLDNTDQWNFTSLPELYVFGCPLGNQVMGMFYYLDTTSGFPQLTYAACGVGINNGGINGNYCSGSGLPEDYWLASNGGTGPGYDEMLDSIY